MKLLFKIALNLLTVRKNRTIFAIIGISMGIFLLVSSQILITSVEESHRNSIREQYGDYDLVVGYQNSNQFLSNQDIEQIKNIDHIMDTSPFLYPYLGKEVEMQLSDYPSYVGFKDEKLAYEYPLIKIAEGNFPKEKEVLIPAAFAKSRQLEVGSYIEWPFPPNKTQKIKIAGILDANQRLNHVAIFQYNWLQSITNNMNNTTALLIKLDKPTNKGDVIKAINEKYPDIFIDKRKELDKERENIGGLKPIIQGLNIAVFIASGLIVISTLHMSIQEKQHELATLRLLAIHRKQIFLLILIEGCIIGLFSLLLGLIVGIISSMLLLDLVGHLMGLTTTDVTLSLPWINIILGSTAAFLILIISSCVPAYQATKLSPLVAYNQSNSVHQAPTKKRAIISSILSLSAVILFFANYLYFEEKILYVVIALLLFCSLFISIPLIFIISTSFYNCLPKQLYSPEWMLSSRNILRQMRRNSQIASILIVGIHVLIIGNIILSSLKEGEETFLKEQYPFDLSIISLNPAEDKGFSPKLFSQLQQMKELENIYFTNSVLLSTLNLPAHATGGNPELLVNEQKQAMLGIQGISFPFVNEKGTITVVDGTINEEDLGQNGVILTEKTSKQLGYKIGDEIETGKFDDVINGKKYEAKTFILKGIIKDEKLDYTLLTTDNIMSQQFGINSLYKIQININNSEKSSEIKANINKLLSNSAYSTAILYDQKQELEKLEKQSKQRLLILSVTVLLIILMAGIGLMNNTASSIRERILELAMLRALGSSKGQLMRILLLEGVFITSLVGIISILIATLIGCMFILALGSPVTSIPINLILSLIAASPLLGLLSVFIPALWITRQNITQMLTK
ncbi:hypothetical protein CON64_11080 [Bacillus pseudomycoides]|nr:hypothetical protein CON64_11080 [Bacillus pseudomycoides]